MTLYINVKIIESWNKQLSFYYHVAFSFFAPRFIFNFHKTLDRLSLICREMGKSRSQKSGCYSKALFAEVGFFVLSPSSHANFSVFGVELQKRHPVSRL